MNRNKTQRVNLNIEYTDDIGEYYDIEVELSLYIEYDGIGHYEYWGSNCYDKGNPFIDDYIIESIVINGTNEENKRDMPVPYKTIKQLIEKDITNGYLNKYLERD